MGESGGREVAALVSLGRYFSNEIWLTVQCYSAACRVEAPTMRFLVTIELLKLQKRYLWQAILQRQLLIKLHRAISRLCNLSGAWFTCVWSDLYKSHLVVKCPKDLVLAVNAPSSIISPLLQLCAPMFMDFTEKRSRRALIDHFCNVLSHLLVFKEDAGNPFRQLVLPLSHASSPVMNALFALSSAHLESRGIENVETSLVFHNTALQGLAQLIDEHEQAHREEILGAIMLLVYYEVVSTTFHKRKTQILMILACPERNFQRCQWTLERRHDYHEVWASSLRSNGPVS